MASGGHSPRACRAAGHGPRQRAHGRHRTRHLLLYSVYIVMVAMELCCVFRSAVVDGAGVFRGFGVKLDVCFRKHRDT